MRASAQLFLIVPITLGCSGDLAVEAPAPEDAEVTAGDAGSTRTDAGSAAPPVDGQPAPDGGAAAPGPELDATAPVPAACPALTFDTVAPGPADPEPFGWLDAPLDQTRVVGEELVLSGWILDDQGVTAAEARLDGSHLAPIELGRERPDLCAVFPGYPGCGEAGFRTTVTPGDLGGCAHLLEVAATDAEGHTRVIARIRIFGPDFVVPPAPPPTPNADPVPCLGASPIATGMGPRARMALGDVNGDGKWDAVVTNGTHVKAIELCSGATLWQTDSRPIGGQGFEYDGHLPGDCRTTATTPQAQTDCGYYSHSTFGFVTNDRELLYIGADRRTIVVLDGETGGLKELIGIPVNAYFQFALKSDSGRYIATSPAHSSHPRVLAILGGPPHGRILMSRSGDDPATDPPWGETFHYMPPMVMRVPDVGDVVFHGNRIYDVETGALLSRAATPGQNGGGLHALSVGELDPRPGPEVSYSVYGPASGNPSILTHNVATGALTGRCFSPVSQLHPHLNSVGNYQGTGDLILVQNRDMANHYFCTGSGEETGTLTGQSPFGDESTQRIDWDGSPRDDVLYITGRTYGAIVSDTGGRTGNFLAILRQSQVYDVWGDGKEEVVFLDGSANLVIRTNQNAPLGDVPIKRGTAPNYDNLKKLTCGLYNAR